MPEDSILTAKVAARIATPSRVREARADEQQRLAELERCVGHLAGGIALLAADVRATHSATDDRGEAADESASRRAAPARLALACDEHAMKTMTVSTWGGSPDEAVERFDTLIAALRRVLEQCCERARALRRQRDEARARATADAEALAEQRAAGVDGVALTSEISRLHKLVTRTRAQNEALVARLMASQPARDARVLLAERDEAVRELRVACATLRKRAAAADDEAAAARRERDELEQYARTLEHALATKPCGGDDDGEQRAEARRRFDALVGLRDGDSPRARYAPEPAAPQSPGYSRAARARHGSLAFARKRPAASPRDAVTPLPALADDRVAELLESARFAWPEPARPESPPLDAPGGARMNGDPGPRHAEPAASAVAPHETAREVRDELARLQREWQGSVGPGASPPSVDMPTSVGQLYAP